MAKKTGKGFYHTGEDSFCTPQIQFFADSSGTGFDFKWGPFRTYEAAWRDLNRMVSSSIRNLQDLHDNMQALKRKGGK